MNDKKFTIDDVCKLIDWYEDKRQGTIQAHEQEIYNKVESYLKLIADKNKSMRK